MSHIAAGEFGKWLAQARESLLGNAGADVPCGDCVGCCTSSYFIPIRPREKQALRGIPAKFLVSAPGQPGGHVMMRYLSDGSCPMLTAGKCSIYQRRPQTCRDYDCRIFAAAGIDAGGNLKAVINQRVRSWRFTYPTDADQRAHEAVRAAAAFIQEKRNLFPGGRAPTAPTGIAVLAIKTYAVFLDTQLPTMSDGDIVNAILGASRAFDEILPR